MSSGSQTISVIKDEGAICNICNLNTFMPNNDMLSLNDCKHTYHTSCLIEHVCKNGKECPICKKKIDDIRLSVAVAFQRHSINELIECLK
jgi:hypothetical protein